MATLAMTLSPATLRPNTRTRSIARRRELNRNGGRPSAFSCKATVKENLNDITPMMLASSAVSAIGTACAVFALATSADATATLTKSAVGLEVEETVEMEYSSSSMKAAPGVKVTAEEGDYRQSGEELFDCEIRSVRCNA